MVFVDFAKTYPPIYLDMNSKFILMRINCFFTIFYNGHLRSVSKRKRSNCVYKNYRISSDLIYVFILFKCVTIEIVIIIKGVEEKVKRLV